MPIPSAIPHPIPAGSGSGVSVPGGSVSRFSQYDVSIAGLPFMFANTTTAPNIRQTAPFEKTRIDQAQTPGEQTLTGWWIKSQDSFHGGAGQLQLEPAVETPVTHVRFDYCKNVDVFTPGLVRRLPDTAVVSTATVVDMAGCNVAGADALVYVTAAGGAVLLTSLDTTPLPTAFSGSGISNVVSVATDGLNVYVATHTDVYKLDPNNVSSATKLATYPTTTTDAVLGWQKARLMLGQAGSVWGLDVSQTGVTLVAAGTDPYYLYTHPSAGFKWRCFSESPTAILAAGDAGGLSIILQFDTQSVGGVPTLGPDGQMAEMPFGERILSMKNSQGTYLGIGTTKGIRVGSFDSYFSRLTFGPLELLPTDPTIPCYDIITRDRFLYAVGMDYDEGGLLAIDLGTKTDDAGRYAWSPHLVTPAVTTSPATTATVLQLSGRIAFYVAGTGICLEGSGPGVNRQSYLRTSRIRYDTTEPKLFKLGRVRGTLASGNIVVTILAPSNGLYSIGTFGGTIFDPPEFRLPTGIGSVEWIQLLLALEGSTTTLTSYGVKALPGTHRQREIQWVLTCADRETTRNGLQITNLMSARARLSALEAFDTLGDEVTITEYTPTGPINTLVVIESMKFDQIGRPTNTSDLVGTVTIAMRTVEQ